MRLGVAKSSDVKTISEEMGKKTFGIAWKDRRNVEERRGGARGLGDSVRGWFGCENGL